MTTYTLFGQPASPASIVSDSTAYTLGVQFSVASSGYTLTGIWFYSASGAASLPSTIGLYAVSGTSLVHSETPSWSGAAGSGWVKATFASPPSLTSGAAYKGCVLDASPGGNWYSATSHYWDTGSGSSGITSGPDLSAPNNAGGSGGQDTLNTGSTIAYPSSSFNAANYWVDVEVTPPSAALSVVTGSLPTAALSASYSATLTATGGTGTGYTWSISSGALPGWASLNTSTGVISGTAPGSAGSTSFTVEVTDSGSNTATQPLTLFVAAPGTGTGLVSVFP